MEAAMQRRRAGSTRPGFARQMRLPVLAACACLIGFAAAAEDDDAASDDDGDDPAVRALTTQWSRFESGAIYSNVDGDPSAFAQYRGLEDEHVYVLGNVDLFRRAPWDADSTQYYRLRGLNLGLDSRSVDAEYGHQGLFGLSFLFDELPVYKTRTANSFFLGVGTSELTLPAGWVAGGRADTPLPGAPGFPTAFQTSIQDNVDLENIGWQRRKLGGGVSVVLPADLEFTAGYSYETRHGERLIGSVFGTSGGDPRAVIHPGRIDYHTQQIDAALRYGGERVQLELAYFGSAFDDDEKSQIWLNPYTANASWDPSAGFQGPPGGVIADCVGVPTCGTGQRSLPPDNWFNQLVASGGVDLPGRTRVTLQTAFGWATQDDGFLPYTINPVLTAVTQGGVPTTGTDLAALPRNSLEGEIFTSVVDFGIASRPLEKLRVDTGYRFERRDNDTPRDLYIYIPSDSADQGTIEGSTARYNLPYSLTVHEANFETGYTLPRRSELSLGYEWQMTKRDYQEIDELQAHSLLAGLVTRPARWVNARLNYEHTWRNGSSYDGSNPFLKSHSQEFIDEELAAFALPGSSCALAGFTPEECLWENHPLLRKFYLANLDRDRFGAVATVLPLEDVSVSFSFNWWQDDYRDTDVGLTSMEHVSPGFEVSYAPTEWLSTYSFYNYERRISDSTGVEYSNVEQAFDPTRVWTSQEKVRTHTAGAGVSLHPFGERLGIGIDYLFAHSHGAIETLRAPGATLAAPAPFPDLLSRQHNVSVHVDYHFTDSLAMRVGYLFQDLETDDWAYDGLGPTSLTCTGTACVIGTGQNSPHYTANVVSWSVVYTFW
jgi:MtrB/PioB family decaheme-associated outer membrane protein